jgi:hypothetical protein
MAEQEKEQEKKIIIDEDWKKEAEREKEILAAQEEAQKKEAQEDQKPPGPLPKGNFAALISMLTTQTLFALGLIQVRGQDERKPDLEMARYNIDLLETLQEKTKGNLTKEEEKVLKNTISEIRMGYVKVADKTSQNSQ